MDDNGNEITFGATGLQFTFFPFWDYLQYINTHNEKEVQNMLNELEDSIMAMDKTKPCTERCIIHLKDLKYFAKNLQYYKH